jgi:hypothetical protein
MTDHICPCGHDASRHELLDDDAGHAYSVEWRREHGYARWHWICTADVHPDGMDSPWDHVCGCLINVYEREPGVPTVDPSTPPVVADMLREALRPEVTR